MMRTIQRLILLLVALCAIVACEKSSTNDTGYGFVQFKVVKMADTRTNTPLDYLADAAKMEVTLQHDGSTIVQTLTLASYDANTAEWGLYSEKLRLLAGNYSLIGIRLYDTLDREIYFGNSAESFSIQEGGLYQQVVVVECVERGKVAFTLSKEFYDQTRAEGAYPFNKIQVVDITVRHKFTGKTTTLKGLSVAHKTDFSDGTMDEEHYDRNGLTAYAVCAGEYSLEAGDYTITAYATYADKRGASLLEHCNTAERNISFTVEDNRTTSVELAIRLSLTAEHIKDYYALREIWLALDGPNWTYHGQAYTSGANWDFNKDVDMWGSQPGVDTDADGRIISLNISGFGARGIVPDAIGQLTELAILYLGDHNEMIGGFDPTPSARISAMDYHDRVVKPLNESTEPSIKPLDMAFGEITNDIRGISRAIKRLTKLEQFFIANSPITADGFFVDIQPESPFYGEDLRWSRFELLTDIEIYNCPNLERLPMEMLGELPAAQSLNISLNQGISGEQLLADWRALINSPIGETIQILYMGYNNLEETPEYDELKRMSKLGLLDCTNNRLKVVHPFGKEVSLTKLYYDFNQIERLYAAEDGYYCGLSQIEEFSVRNNRLETLPDVFTARSVYVMGSVNFSNNRITSFENGDAWGGVNTETLNLANNRLTEWPKTIFASGSSINVLMIGGNGMRNIPEGAFTGSRVRNLTTLDLSYNRLSALPADFNADNIPYLYGVDMSCNAFEALPFDPLPFSQLTVISIRQQRDDEGNRTFTVWPQGIGKCPKMAALYVGSNDLGVIDDEISPYILLFEIKDNPNISIDLSSVCPYIEKGYYELVYDSTQDIRGCDALKLDK